MYAFNEQGSKYMVMAFSNKIRILSLVLNGYGFVIMHALCAFSNQSALDYV